MLCRSLIELLALNINVPLYFNFRVRHNIRRLADDQSSQLGTRAPREASPRHLYQC